MRLALEISKFKSVAARTTEDALEALDGFLQGHQFTQMAGEDLGHLEGLGQETLDLASAGHSKFVLFRQLIHSQNGNDVLQGFVVLYKRELIRLFRKKKNPNRFKKFQDSNLKNLLHTTGNVVMLRTHDVGVHDTGGGVQGVHGGVDPQLSNGTRQHSGSIQVSKGGGRCRVSQVISWHVNSLRES